MKNQHLPFEHLEKIRDWVNRCLPVESNARTMAERDYRKVTSLIAELQSLSVSVPRELEARERELKATLSSPDPDAEIMNHLADELISIAKQIQAHCRSTGIKIKALPKTLSAKFPDGYNICEAQAVETFVNALCYLGLNKCAKIKDIIQFGHPVVSSEENERASATRHVDGYYIETHSSTATKAKILQQYADRIGIPIDIQTK